jgi:hypothetical protein
MGLFSFFKAEEPAMPDLMFFNTLSGTIEEFSPLSHREVKMYNCGPTVYDQQHITSIERSRRKSATRLPGITPTPSNERHAYEQGAIGDK